MHMFWVILRQVYSSVKVLISHHFIYLMAALLIAERQAVNFTFRTACGMFPRNTITIWGRLINNLNKLDLARHTLSPLSNKE